MDSQGFMIIEENLGSNLHYGLSFLSERTSTSEI